MIFLSFKKAQGSPKGIKGGTVQNAAKGLAGRRAVGEHVGLSIRSLTGPGGQAVKGEQSQPCFHFGVTVSCSPASLSLSLLICTWGPPVRSGLRDQEKLSLPPDPSP